VPISLVWLFPFELERAREISKQPGSGIRQALANNRLQSSIINLSKFFATLLLVLQPRALWLSLHFLLTVPLRLLESTETIKELHLVDLDVISNLLSPVGLLINSVGV
jgi:hypothetical protein